MAKKLTAEAIGYVIARLIDNANEAVAESRKDKGDLFKDGRALAYYEMLDILQAELSVSEEDLREYGLDFDIDGKYL